MITNRTQTSLAEIENFSPFTYDSFERDVTILGRMKTDEVGKYKRVAILCVDVIWLEYLHQNILPPGGELGDLIEQHPFLGTSRGCITKSPVSTKETLKSDQTKTWWNVKLGLKSHLFQVISHYGDVVRFVSKTDPKLVELPI